MLEKIIRLNNIGVFRQGLSKAMTFEKASLIYAENARGKSTLAALLNSLASGDTSAVAARATFGSGSPNAELRFSFSGKGFNAQLKDGNWDTTVPQLLVFDQSFVERNVYAGSEVNPDHHQALLEFALGTAAVQKKAEVENAGQEQLAATKRRTAAEDQLKGYRGKATLDAFLKLTNEAEVDEKVEALQRRIADAKDAASISARVSLKELAPLSFGFSGIKATFEKSLEDIHADAEKIVRAHLSHYPGTTAEAWTATGLKLLKGEACPFCGQSTADVDLVAAYKTFFNQAYAALQADVDKLPGLIASAVGGSALANAEATVAANLERLNTWAPQLKLELDHPDLAGIKAEVANVCDVLAGFVATKQKAPLQSLNVMEEVGELEKRLAGVVTVIASYNEKVSDANQHIDNFKKQLASDKPADLEAEVAVLQLRKVRHSTEVVGIVEQRSAADQDRTNWETAKGKARKELDELMDTVLGTFQDSINAWLTKFGAPFTVKALKANYQGGGVPRTEYGIAVRGVSVPAGRKLNGPSFQTALSDGDKRTLALAFFLARLFAETEIGIKVVVLDDLFTSLDKHRRAQTVDAITLMARSVSQVIVLAHDAFFLRDVSRRLAEKKICQQVILHARRANDGFSEIDVFDLEDVCASDYYKRYRALRDFLEGAPSESALSVAQGLRGLLEGHLHRRFPGRVKEGVTLGVVLDQIKTAQADNPMTTLQQCLLALHELNDFASGFHHDTSGVAPRAEVTDAELVAYGSRTMLLLHTGQV